MSKVIITCALTGSVHTPSMSPYLPVTADEIVRAGVEAAEAGASILHLHVRDPKDGRPSQDLKLFEPVLGKLKAEVDAVLNITTGGATIMTVDERIAPALEFQPELASLNMGTINFAMFPMLRRYQDFQHDWEEPYLAGSKNNIFRNTFGDIERILTAGSANGTKFEYECYDIGHLYNLSWFVKEELVPMPMLIQSVFGVMGGIGTHPEDLMHMRRTADRLFGGSYQWSILGAGRAQVPLATMGAAIGSHVRVGLEDSLFLRGRELATSNAAQVQRIRTVLEDMGLEVATPEEARTILELKGSDNVHF